MLPNPDVSAVTLLTRANSVEIGVSARIIPNLGTSLDVFKLKLRSESVSDGDAGATAASRWPVKVTPARPPPSISGTYAGARDGSALFARVNEAERASEIVSRVTGPRR